MQKYPFYLQENPAMDGVACIRMILKYYGIDEDSLTIKKKCRVDRQGTSLKGMATALASYAIEASVLTASVDAIACQPRPCILVRTEAHRPHYVVLFEKKGAGYLIGDPASGICQLSLTELPQETYQLIVITHLGRYYDFGPMKLSSLIVKVVRKQPHVFLRMAFAGLLSGVSFLLIGLMLAALFDHPSADWLLIAALVLIICLTGVHLLYNAKTKQKDSLALQIDAQMHSEIERSLLADDRSVQGIPSVADQLKGLDLLARYMAAWLCFIYYDGPSDLLFMLFLLYLNREIFMAVLISILLMIFLAERKCVHAQKRIGSECLFENHYHQSLYDWLSHHQMRHIYQKSFAKSHQDYLTAQAKKHQAKRHLEMAWRLWNSAVFVAVLLYGGRSLPLGRWLLVLMLVFILMYDGWRLCDLFFEEPMAQKRFMDYKELSSLDLTPKHAISEQLTTLAVHNLSYHYGSHDNVISHLDAVFDHSMLITGPSGSGKSTLLKLFAGMDDDYHGHILLNGQEIRTLDHESLRQHVIYLGSLSFIDGELADNFLCEDENAVERLLEQFNATSLKTYLPYEIFSDGSPLCQRDRVLLALMRALLQKADVYLIDGLFDALSATESNEIIARLLKLYPQHIFLISTVHHLSVGLDVFQMDAQNL